MVKDAYQYSYNAAFGDAGARSVRVKERYIRKKRNNWFRKKRAEQQKEERAAFLAAKQAEEDALAEIATSVALACLNLD